MAQGHHPRHWSGVQLELMVGVKSADPHLAPWRQRPNSFCLNAVTFLRDLKRSFADHFSLWIQGTSENVLSRAAVVSTRSVPATKNGTPVQSNRGMEQVNRLWLTPVSVVGSAEGHFCCLLPHSVIGAIVWPRVDAGLRGSTAIHSTQLDTLTTSTSSAISHPHRRTARPSCPSLDVRCSLSLPCRCAGCRFLAVGVG